MRSVADAKPAASLLSRLSCGTRECRASRNRGEGYGSGEEPGSAAVRDSPAYGARNVSRVVAGTGRPSPAR